MKRTMVLRTDELKAAACRVVGDVPLNDLHELIIRPYKVNRSVEQNNLYWKWMTEIGNEAGWEKEEVDSDYKGRFLVQIYRRDDEEYEATVQAVHKVRAEGLMDEYAEIKKQIIKMTSTAKASVAQMSEYMNSVQRHALSRGYQLTIPADMHWMNER